MGSFPEATISRSFEPKEFKSGAERLAKASKAPLIPVAVWGSQRLWTYDDRASLKQRGVPISVYVGEPVEPALRGDAANEELQAPGHRSSCIERRMSTPTDGTDQWWQPVRLGGTAPAAPTERLPQTSASARRPSGQRALLRPW